METTRIDSGKSYQIPDVLRDCIPEYLERRVKDIKDLKEFLYAGDFASIGHLGHKLLGSGTSYGFERISGLGQNFLAMARSKDVQELHRLIMELENEVDSIRTWLK